MKFPDDYINKIHCSGALEFLKSLPDECIDMCMTSPPYWGLRDYKIQGQIGLEQNYQDYINKLVEVFRELKRVLKKTGVFYLNMGDTYMDKELLMIPSQLALALKKDNFQLRNILIWHKPNSLPSSVKDRYKNSYEFVFFFVKNRRYYFNLDSIREPHKTEIKIGDRKAADEHPKSKYNGVFRGGMKLPPHPGNPGAFHPLGKNPGDVQEIDKERGYKSLGSHPGNTPIGGLVEKSKLGVDIRHPLGTNPGDCADDTDPEDFWAINTKPFKGAHFAVFPEKLCEKPIKSSCPEDGIVIDPFCGSGTVCVVAHRFGRNYIGVDLNPDYCEIARKRLEKEKDNRMELKLNVIK